LRVAVRTPRRQFIKAAGTAALAGAGLALPHTLPAGTRAEEKRAPAAARLLVGCCAYSFRKHFESGMMTMEDFIRKAVEMGVDGVDITTYWLKSTEPAYLASLRHLAFKNGLPFSGAAIATNLCEPDAAKRAEQLEKIKSWVDATDRLGASHLRVFGGTLPEGATVQQGVEWVAESMKPACEYAAQKGITLGIEDHHGITSRAEPILEILRRVDSPYAGINLDITNFAARSSDEQYHEIAACVPFATHTHIRDHFSETHEPVDLDRVWQIFAQGGYRGYMSAEYEGEEDPFSAVPRLIRQIRTLCRKYSNS
jgi:sugar phosphate isomerase/epimerase